MKDSRYELLPGNVTWKLCEYWSTGFGENDRADVNTVSKWTLEGTALQAARVGKLSNIVKFLLENGANSNEERGIFTNPIIAATQLGQPDIVELLTDLSFISCKTKLDLNKRESYSDGVYSI